MQLQSLIGTQVSRLSESIRNQQIFFVLSFFSFFWVHACLFRVTTSTAEPFLGLDKDEIPTDF